jgi:hypothetical protein
MQVEMLSTTASMCTRKPKPKSSPLSCSRVSPQTATAEALPGCPLCKKPLGGVLRYGRPLARRRLDLAEGKWLAAAGRVAAEGQAALGRGRAAVEHLLAGLLHQPPPRCHHVLHLQMVKDVCEGSLFHCSMLSHQEIGC